MYECMRSTKIGSSVKLGDLTPNDTFVVFCDGPVYEVISVSDDKVELYTLFNCGPGHGVVRSYLGGAHPDRIVYPLLEIFGYTTRWGIEWAKRKATSESFLAKGIAAQAEQILSGQNEKLDADKPPAWDYLITELWDFWVEPRLGLFPEYLQSALKLCKEEKWSLAADTILLSSDHSAIAFQYGAEKKYTKGSWQKIENGHWRVKQAAGRHLHKLLQGHLTDAESGHSHLVHLEWCIVVTGWYQAKNVELAA